MAATFTRKTGHEHCRKFPSTGTMAAGVLVQFDEGGNVAIGATNKSVVGILKEAAASSNVVLVDMLTSDDEIEATGITASVPISAASVGATFDQAAGADLAASSNKDFICVAWDGTSTNRATLICTNTVRGGSKLV